MYKSQYIGGQKEKFVRLDDLDSTMSMSSDTAYIAPSSRVFGRGELVIDSSEIARRYLHRYFFVDLASVLPLPQIVVYRFLHGKSAESTGSFAESAWAGAAYYLLWFMLAAQVTGAAWYLLSVERYDTCWRDACIESGKCRVEFLYCGSEGMQGFSEWDKIRVDVLNQSCSTEGDEKPFNFGIFEGAISSNVISSTEFFSKFLFCLWWGLKNLRDFIFIGIGTLGLILFALLIGNIQTYLQSLTIRLEEMRIKRRDSEQWMHHRWLPQDLRERVRRYDQYKWLETRGVDEESIVQTLPKDLRRDIKRHLCLNLVRRVPLFTNMDERQVQYTFRFYSQQWRTWAACFIQTAWRHYRSKATEKQRREEEGGFGYSDGDDDDYGGGDDFKGGSGKPGLGATILASRFAANALRGHRRRSSSTRELMQLQKPPEPDFSTYND
ncbi:hypothetical protein M0R45_031395 [Rubus argutus]|uniref:Uncharacterized protein n=1 Tax=Rubus argutus TaxID=59490 RepID=A0AAW1WEC2_RUBAR